MKAKYNNHYDGKNKKTTNNTVIHHNSHGLGVANDLRVTIKAVHEAVFFSLNTSMTLRPSISLHPFLGQRVFLVSIALKWELFGVCNVLK